MAGELYKPLTSEDSTRFLTLQPGRFYDPLVATLKESKPNLVRFEAISYTWGPPQPEESIIINGHVLPIRQNLANCLRQIRYKERKRRLWVDAFSSSQTDMKEKNDQVANIASVFKEASYTLAWMGEHDPWTRLLFKKVAIDSMETMETTEMPSKRGILSVLFGRKAGKKKQVSEKRFDTAMIRLMMNPYWERRWVMQELILAPKVLVVCGKDSAELEPFLQTAAYSGSSIATLLELRPEYHQNRVSENLRSLIEVCFMFSDTRCLEPRDKVYALLQMSTVRDALKPDYEKSAEQLFVDVLLLDLDVLRERLEVKRRETLLLCEESRLPALLERWEMENYLLIENLATSLGVTGYRSDPECRERLIALALQAGPAENQSSTARRKAAVATLRMPAPPIYSTLEGFKYTLEFQSGFRAMGAHVNNPPPQLISPEGSRVQYFM